MANDQPTRTEAGAAAETGRERLARIEGAITAAHGFKTSSGYVDPDVPWLVAQLKEARAERDGLLRGEDRVAKRVVGILSAADVPVRFDGTVYDRVERLVKQRDDALAALADRERENAELKADNDRLRQRTHEIQEAADKRYGELAQRSKYWNYLIGEADELTREPGVVLQSAVVRATVAHLIAQREAAERALAACREAARAVVDGARPLWRPGAAAGENQLVPGPLVERLRAALEASG